MPDRFDEGARALDGVEPPDLWDRIEQREPADERPLEDLPPHRRPLLLAAAAVVVAVALVAAVVSWPDRPSRVSTASPDEDGPSPTTGPDTTEDEREPVVIGGYCPFTLTQVAPEDLESTLEAGYATGAPPEASGSVAHGELADGTVVEIHAPAMFVRDFVGEQTEEVRLDRQPPEAVVWVGDDFVQVRYTPADDEPCAGFDVTVFDRPRGIALDLALATANALVLTGDDPAPGLDCPHPLVADLDGDGDTEHVSSVEAEAYARVVRVCDEGEVIEGDLESNGEVFRLVDVDEDGVAEIAFGGTTASAAFSNLAVLDDGRLVQVSDESGDPLLLVDGYHDSTRETWGCAAGGLVVAQGELRPGGTVEWLKRELDFDRETASLDQRDTERTTTTAVADDPLVALALPPAWSIRPCPEIAPDPGSDSGPALIEPSSLDECGGVPFVPTWLPEGWSHDALPDPGDAQARWAEGDAFVAAYAGDDGSASGSAEPVSIGALPASGEISSDDGRLSARLELFGSGCPLQLWQLAAEGIDRPTFERIVQSLAPTLSGFAVWPFDSAADLLTAADDVDWPTDGDMAAVEFAREVLGWDDPSVSDREPSEDGRSGASLSVTAGGDGPVIAMDVACLGGHAEDPACYVYAVHGPFGPNGSASVSVRGTRASVGARPNVRYASAELRIGHGTEERVIQEERSGFDVDLGYRIDNTGHLLVVWRDDAGRAVGAWGIALPAGTFAAG